MTLCQYISENSIGWLMFYGCMVCSFVYDVKRGLPDHGIPPGTKFEDIPDDWICPDCGLDKSFFEPRI